MAQRNWENSEHVAGPTCGGATGCRSQKTLQKRANKLKNPALASDFLQVCTPTAVGRSGLMIYDLARLGKLSDPRSTHRGRSCGPRGANRHLPEMPFLMKFAELPTSFEKLGNPITNRFTDVFIGDLARVGKLTAPPKPRSLLS